MQQHQFEKYKIVKIILELSIHKSFDIAKSECDDLIYFVEDDYIHKKESIFEMLSSYEKISSEINKELFICPVDYPYLYKKLENSKIFIGNKYHWRSVNESLLTFLRYLTTCTVPFRIRIHFIHKIKSRSLWIYVLSILIKHT